MTGVQRSGAVSSMTLADCQRVYDELASRDLATLDRDDATRLADAAFWLGMPRESIAARERSYGAARDAGDAGRAAIAAWLLFHAYFDLDETAIASGWLTRGEEHVAEIPGSVEEGYLAVSHSESEHYAGRLDMAARHARHAVDLGRRHGDRDIVALGQVNLARTLVARGDVADGTAMLDATMVAAVGDELSAFVTGWVYCALLSTCEELGDVRRAAEWSDHAMRWADSRGQESWYPGLCTLHRCEVQSMRGEWNVAERQALWAAEKLVPYGDWVAAEGWYLAGEIRRRRGELAKAEQAFRRAHELGLDPQPGMALVRLARGDAEGAARTLRTALAGSSRGAVRRARLLAAHVEAALLSGDVGGAGTSAQELSRLAADTGVLMLRGMAALAQGSVLVTSGDGEAAMPFLQDAKVICRELSCPYDEAVARRLLGMAARRAGDEHTARLEFEAAAAGFRRLGAEPDAERAEALAAHVSALPKGLTEREAEVLALVARGSTNREIAAALFLSEHTVARHLSNIFRKLGVSSRSAATAFAFEHDLAGPGYVPPARG